VVALPLQDGGKPLFVLYDASEARMIMAIIESDAIDHFFAGDKVTYGTNFTLQT
jgi:hypothetical protein